MNILGIIPARGGSKGVPNKNIIDLQGKPLIAYTIDSALQSKLINKLVVSTNSKRISNVVSKNYDIQVIDRPAKYAMDTSPIEEALLHAVQYLIRNSNYHSDIVVWMQANVPIRKPGVIDKVISKLVNSNADACVTCYEVTQKPEIMKIINEDGFLEQCQNNVEGIRRQELPKRYMADGAVVAIRAKNLLRYKGIRKAHVYLGKKVLPVIQDSMIYSLEIDEHDDLFLGECYIKNISKKRVKNIEHYLKIIDEVEIVRKNNNINWMDILRLAFKNAPEEAKSLMQKINTEDDHISSLLKKLSNV